ncbi:type II toxin-antitoxin system HicB family antitoxin [Candidatus Uhrbacteria bacterium]|nr:type II toxin-antitoxin system HicB family antitoxin [Candidatus Uhrbacteria bacterium]
MSSKITNQKQFKILIERDEDGFFVATVPSLPGCHVQAKSINDLMDRVKEAIELSLEVAKVNPKYRERIKRFAYNPVFVGMEMVSL